jgi:hypothetical protein
MNKFFRNVIGFALHNRMFVFFMTVVAIIFRHLLLYQHSDRGLS